MHTYFMGSLLPSNMLVMLLVGLVVGRSLDKYRYISSNIVKGTWLSTIFKAINTWLLCCYMNINIVQSVNYFT